MEVALAQRAEVTPMLAAPSRGHRLGQHVDPTAAVDLFDEIVDDATNPYKSKNWVLEADPTWNNFTANGFCTGRSALLCPATR